MSSIDEVDGRDGRGHVGHTLSFAEVDMLEACADGYDSFGPNIFSLRYGKAKTSLSTKGPSPGPVIGLVHVP